MFRKNNTFFPQISDTACQLKWTWSTINLSKGVTNSCHRCLNIPLNPENFDNFHNLPHKITERKIMQKNQWPTKENGGSGHCTYCKKIEDVGGTSDRMLFSKAPNLVPHELLEDNHAVFVTPKILEIYINSKCNLKCRYCGPNFSTAWQKEIERHGDMKWDGDVQIPAYKYDKQNEFYDQLKDKMLQWIEKNGHKLERLHFLGGETFYTNEIHEFIEVLSKIKNRNLQVNIVSNLMVKENQFNTIIGKFEKLIKDKCIGRLDLTASIDGMGPEAEYARTGLNCEYFNKMFDIAIKKKWITLNVNQTISVLTMKSMINLHKWLNDKRKIKKNIRNRFGNVIDRPFLHINTFGKDIWKDDFRDNLLILTENNEQERLEKKYLQGIFDSVPEHKDFKNIKLCHQFLDQLDKRRNTNWREVLPHLDI